MKRTIHLIAILIIALATQPSLAEKKGGKQRNKGSQGGVTASQAASMAQRQTGGRVLSVQESGGGYRVRVLTRSGEVRSVKISGRR